MRYKVNYWYLKFIFFNIVGIYLINYRAVDPAVILTTTCRQPAEQGTAADHQRALPERERQRGAEQHGCKR